MFCREQYSREVNAICNEFKQIAPDVAYFVKGGGDFLVESMDSNRRPHTYTCHRGDKLHVHVKRHVSRVSNYS